MKKLTDIICIFTAAALLLAGCNSGSGEEIDLSPDPIETEEERLTLDSLRKSNMNPFIMPGYGTEEYDYYSSMLTWGDECIPGKLYLQCTVNRNESAILLLSDIIFKEAAGLYSYQPWDRKMIYAVAVGEDGEEGDSLLKVDQETGQDTTLYHVDGEAIDFMINLGHYIYFSSGSRILYVNLYTDEVDLFVECEGEVTDLAYTLDSIAWAEGDGKYFLYDREEKEGVPINYDELFPFNELYYYIFRNCEDGTEQLYLVTAETDEEELIADNVTRVLYASVRLMYAQVGNDRIISVNNRDGNIETVYYAQTEDTELLSVSVIMDEPTENVYVSGLFLREGQDIVRADLDATETKTLFRLENGLAEDSYGGRELYGCQFAENSLDMLMRIENELDMDKFYICEDCDRDYCIWADKDRNWFWYHPHSGENEDVEVTMVSGCAYITQKEQLQ